jgi:stearoyl-CoA desaturase (delta-9 desaturase)
MPAQTTAVACDGTAAYDGTAAFPDVGLHPDAIGGPVQVAVTAAIAGVPLVGLGVAIWLLWGHGVGLTDVLLMAGLYLITGLGVTVGFHRCFTHRSFRAVPALRAVLAVAGSMSFEGSVIAWVATHRRHHAFTDQPGDPHSPYRYGTSVGGLLRGLAHAHLGWMFRDDPTPASRYAPDMMADRAMRVVSAGFPALCVASLAIPFGAGWAIGGSARAALTALLWAGLVRICLLQHVTWSVNSLCHLLGSRPFTTRRFDRATNLWPLALLSFGESWHNMHHSDPACARHGVGPGQIDIAAGTIALFERLRWATDVRWPTAARLDSHRRRDDATGQDRGRHPDNAPTEPAMTSAAR